MNIRLPLIIGGLYVTGSRAWRAFEIIRSIEKLSKEKIEHLQAIRLKKILLHSYQNVPYYNKILRDRKVVQNNQTVNLANFERIPFLTKEIIRRQGDDLFSRDHKKRGSYLNTSGGSTGEPVRFLQDKQYHDINVVANKLYSNYIVGKMPGEREVNLWGSDRDISTNSQGIKSNILNVIYNRKFLNAFCINEEKLDSFVDAINRFRPVFIWAYVESIEALARYIKDHEKNIHSPRCIITTAGNLYPEIRQLVAGVFQCPVYNQYGSREVGPIGMECTYQNGLHTFPWSHYIEVINKEIIVTLLTNYSMPLLRYKIEDTVVRTKSEKCACGRNTLSLKKISGRIKDHFTALDGSSIHGEYFIHLFYFRTWVKKFQIVQKSRTTIECNAVLRSQPNPQDRQEITEGIKKALGDKMQVHWRFPKVIEPSKSGKYRFTINETI